LISGGNAAKSNIYQPPENQPTVIALAASVTAYDPALGPNVFTNAIWITHGLGADNGRVLSAHR
jgi:hypothetical protein